MGGFINDQQKTTTRINFETKQRQHGPAEWLTVNGLSECVIVDEFVSEVLVMMSCGTTAAIYIGLGHMNTHAYVCTCMCVCFERMANFVIK